jgi:putative sugar O-methyltransferase
MRNSLRRLLDASPLDVARAIVRMRAPRPPVAGQTGARFTLTADEIAQLEMMRQDNRGAGPPYTAPKLWQLIVEEFEDVFRREGIGNPEEQYFNLRFSGFSPADARLHRYVCWMYRRILQARDSLGLLHKLRATCRRGRGFAYEMEGDCLSLDLLMSIDDFYNLYEMNPAVASEPTIVAELGAGWGRLGYVLRSVNPGAVYVIFDLPEVLVVSQRYMQALFPDARVADYATGRKVERFTRDTLLQYSLWFLGTQHIRQLDRGAVDVVLNVASFQEMPLAYVAEYVRRFSDIAQGGHCYLRQLRAGDSHGHCYGEIATLEEYPFPKSWVQRYLRPSILTDEFFEAGFAIS